MVEGGRSINQHYVADLHGVVQLARRQRWGKLLVFCNMRQTVEETAATLSTLWHPIPLSRTTAASSASDAKRQKK